MAEFSLVIPGHESLATAIPAIAVGVWLAGNIVLIGWELLLWLVVVLTDVVRRPLEITIYFHDTARTFASGMPRDFRRMRRTRYGRYPLGRLEKVFTLYGLFRQRSFRGELPYEDIDLGLLDVTRSPFSEMFQVRFVFRESGEVRDQTKVLRPGVSEPIPRDNEGNRPFTDYKICAKWVW